MSEFDFLVIGGGAAGFFAALACAEKNPRLRVGILEATPRVLSKVKVSGGGRCNVTHNCFDPRQLVKYYPRGSKELLGPFHRFGPQQTIDWFAARGVAIKAEADGRMFPTTDSSQTIIDCFMANLDRLKVQLRTKCLVEDVRKEEEDFCVQIKGGETLRARRLMIATGSAPFGIKLLAGLGLPLTEPVPSLFTFEIKHPLLEGLSGVSFPLVTADLQTPEGKFTQEGPLLITHWGLSGPAVLRLSAFGARALAACSYQAQLFVNFEGRTKTSEMVDKLQGLKEQEARKKISSLNPLSGPRRFWEALLAALDISGDKLWADLSKKEMTKLSECITRFPFSIQGKGVFKEEFVTAGGVTRVEIDTRNFESKKIPGLYLAGEVLDIDGVTGGFNFQNAWTGAFLAGEDAAEQLTQTADI